MGSGHDHHHHHVKGDKNILIAFFLNASFAVIELIGGYLTNSVAIYSDALHDLGDSLALLFAYFSEKFSHKKEDHRYTFGYRRFSLLSALINGFILTGGSLFVLYEALQRIGAPEPVRADGMLALAILGIAVNSFAAYRLSKNDGMNMRMVRLHLLEDILGWLGVLLVSIVLLYRPWYVLDSILSVLISLIILQGVYKNLLKVGTIFLQKFPDELEIQIIKDQIKNYHLVEDVHAVRGWSIDEENYYLSFHVSVPQDTKIQDLDLLKGQIKQLLSSHKVKYSTVEFEAASNNCHLN